MPDDLAVLGMDNADGLCELGSPPLSSVVTPLFRLGYACAQLLDELKEFSSKVHIRFGVQLCNFK